MTVSHKAVEETTHASALERSPAYVEARRSATDLIEGWEAYEEGLHRLFEAAEWGQWEQACKAEGHEMMSVPGDLGDFDAAAAAMKKVADALGPVDILVNAAGITRDAALRKMTPQQWREVINSNLDSVFNTTRNVIEGMLDRGFGRIINISSVNGQKGQFGQANYAATKAGIHGFTISVAQEGARKGVTCNTAQRHWRNSILAVDQYRLSRCVRFSF